MSTCHCKGDCFAKSLVAGVDTVRFECKILRIGYPDGQCPFQKAVIDETDGIVYPYNPPEPRVREEIYDTK